MRFEGQVRINAGRDEVWAFLTDPEAVSRCAPGVDSFEVVVPGRRFRALASVGLGSVRARFATDAEWLDLEPPLRARMKAHGTAPGSAVDALSSMELQQEADGVTLLCWSADVLVVGTIASVAARLMSGVAQRLTDAFFEKVREHVEAGAAPPAAAAAQQHVPAQPGRAVSLILCLPGDAGLRAGADLEPTLRARIAALGSELRQVDFVVFERADAEARLAGSLAGQVAAGARLVLVTAEPGAGEVPALLARALERSGGQAADSGAPASPRPALVLGSLADAVVLGVRDLSAGVLDRALPRLLAGERLTLEEIAPAP